MRDSRLLIGIASLMAIGSLHAQVKSIPAEGADGLTKEDVTFEPEYRERMRTNFGQFAPAAPGTKPGSTDPRNIEGVWIAGTQEAVGEPARAGGRGGAPGVGGAGAGARNEAAASTGATRALAQNLCRPGSPFTLGTPTQIIQTPQAVYILKVASMSQNGTSYRRIALVDKHSAAVSPTYTGDAIGHWEGDTLVVETIGLKNVPGGRGGPGGGRAQAFTATTRAVERIRKIEGGLKLEDLLTLGDPAAGASTSQTRYVSYWRPDLKFIEAPCEEYADPLETENSGPFSGGDERRGGGLPPGGAGAPPTP